MSFIKEKQFNFVGIWPQNCHLLLRLRACKPMAIWTIRHQISKCPNVYNNINSFHNFISILCIFNKFLENNILSEAPCRCNSFRGARFRFITKCGILDFPTIFGATETKKIARCMCPNFRLITVLWRHNCIGLKRQRQKIFIFTHSLKLLFRWRCSPLCMYCALFVIVLPNRILYYLLLPLWILYSSVFVPCDWPRSSRVIVPELHPCSDYFSSMSSSKFNV